MEIVKSGMAGRIFIGALLLFVAISCVTVPETGRQSFILVSESQEMALGLQSYQQVLKESKLSKDTDTVARVRRIGNRIAKAANKPEYKWEFNVIEDDKTANAFCLPGGKVAVYTGILPYTQNDAGLATVIAHEVGHAIARHGGERMTNAILTQVGQAGLNAALSGMSPAAVQAANVAYGVGSNVGFILPFSRFEESEADHIGLILMAKAGYDPREAVYFWERMASKGGDKPPEFLSTHPSDAKRIQQIKSLLPDALKYYRP
jgi:metalloendopeptidase OMA1, mitochondrial